MVARLNSKVRLKTSEVRFLDLIKNTSFTDEINASRNFVPASLISIYTWDGHASKMERKL